MRLPLIDNTDVGPQHYSRDIHRPDDNPDGLILESWAQGVIVGSLVAMAAVAVSNMRRGVLLHKLILLELVIAIPHGTFIFTPEPVYGWYLAATTIGLIASWSLHNVVAWMKNRPFFSPMVSAFYIGTIILVQPYWILEIYSNFAYFNEINTIYTKVRPLEPLFRDPWWIYTTCNLFWVIKTHYNIGIFDLVRQSPRFGIMLASMCISIAFMMADILSVTGVLRGSALPIGINPFWKFCFVFKCLCDTVVLDDFKTALDKLRTRWFIENGLNTLQPFDSSDDHIFTTAGSLETNSCILTKPPPSVIHHDTGRYTDVSIRGV
ncbi:hypothetical protein FQN54_003836 [Arachnomyces sp. PD_36]|nr:hypothetical protein FQN54_003836 [Arachnomyces sp. PD_36]